MEKKIVLNVQLFNTVHETICKAVLSDQDIQVSIKKNGIYVASFEPAHIASLVFFIAREDCISFDESMAETYFLFRCRPQETGMLKRFLEGQIIIFIDKQELFIELHRKIRGEIPAVFKFSRFSYATTPFPKEDFLSNTIQLINDLKKEKKLIDPPVLFEIDKFDAIVKQALAYGRVGIMFLSKNKLSIVSQYGEETENIEDYFRINEMNVKYETTGFHHGIYDMIFLETMIAFITKFSKNASLFIGKINNETLVMQAPLGKKGKMLYMLASRKDEEDRFKITEIYNKIVKKEKKTTVKPDVIIEPKLFKMLMQFILNEKENAFEFVFLKDMVKIFTGFVDAFDKFSFTENFAYITLDKSILNKKINTGSFGIKINIKEMKPMLKSDEPVNIKFTANKAVFYTSTVKISFTSFKPKNYYENAYSYITENMKKGYPLISFSPKEMLSTLEYAEQLSDDEDCDYVPRKKGRRHRNAIGFSLKGKKLVMNCINIKSMLETEEEKEKPEINIIPLAEMPVTHVTESKTAKMLFLFDPKDLDDFLKIQTKETLLKKKNTMLLLVKPPKKLKENVYMLLFVAEKGKFTIVKGIRFLNLDGFSEFIH